jgi:hypothetical protein
MDLEQASGWLGKETTITLIMSYLDKNLMIITDNGKDFSGYESTL